MEAELKSNPSTRAAWVKAICSRWQETVKSFIEIGSILLDAKGQLQHGEFGEMVEKDLPFGPRTARQFMTIAQHPTISKGIHGSVLPPYWRTLYYLTKVPLPILELALEDGRIHPEMERKDALALIPKDTKELFPSETCEVSDLQHLIDAGKKFGTIYADPPWQYGNQGTRAATHNFYETMQPAEIAALPIKVLAADDSHLHLWTTNAFLFESKAIMEAWGYEYKSVLVWVKPQMGIGNYWRVSHEFLLLGIRGQCPFLDRSQMSWIETSRLEHSEKPNIFRRAIELVSPTPRLELFGRRIEEGWAVWGNEVSRNLFNINVGTFSNDECI